MLYNLPRRVAKFLVAISLDEMQPNLLHFVAVPRK